MNTQSTAFDYDDFELYLLEAASVDQAPQDLPARLGVALGLGVPVLVATEAASLLPTTTSLSTGLGTNLGANVTTTAVPKGIFAALKASLGVGATTLWNTAAKGIAVGLLAGGAALGTGQAVVKVAAMGAPQKTHVVAPSLNRSLNESARPAPAAANANTDDNGDVESGEVDVPLAAAAELSDPGRASGKTGFTGPRSNSVAPHADIYAMGPAPAADNDKPKVRLARRIIPEKTNAVARYPLIYDDVSASYDNAQGLAVPAAAAPAGAVPAAKLPTAAPEPMIDPAELMSLRSKALQRTRTLLGQSKAAQALSELDSFRTRVGERNFGVDELLLHIEALASLGRAKEAQADVTRVERLAPNSPALRQAQLLANSRFVR